MKKRKEPFQIKNIHYIYKLSLYIYQNLSQILKSKLTDKPFLNRRYCQTFNGEGKKYNFKQKIFIIWKYIYPYLFQILKIRLVDKSIFK